MKTWLLMMMFVLLSVFAFGCVSDGTDDGTDDETVETSTTSSDLTYSCTARCTSEYQSCVTGDPLDDCLCRNAYVTCRRTCGYPGWLTQC